MINVAITGPPGCGKGKHSRLLARKMGLVRIAPGEIIRSEIVTGSPFGKNVKSWVSSGLLVEDRLVMKKLFAEVKQYPSSSGFVFDGFPRSLNQAIFLDRFLRFYRIPFTIVITLTASEKELINRVKLRLKYNNREDDTDEIFRKRMHIYREQTLPLIDYYEKQNKIFHVNSEAPVCDVHEIIYKKVKEVAGPK